eukprot:COSAG02_NODE_366_length_23740_cov_20.235904_21_plen_54_part_00
MSMGEDYVLMVLPCEPLVALGRKVKVRAVRDLDGLIEEARKELGLMEAGELEM